MFYTKCITQYRLAAMIGLWFVALSATAAAPVADLGQSWPQTRDVSTSAPWHVYVFHRDNVDYVQVNDVSGTVRAAFATASGQVLILPMGSDSQRVSVSQAVQTPPSIAGGQVVYRNDQLSLLVTPQANGFQWQVVLNTAPTATAAACDSKGDCGNHAMASTATTTSTGATADSCTSKGECGNHAALESPSNP